MRTPQEKSSAKFAGCNPEEAAKKIIPGYTASTERGDQKVNPMAIMGILFFVLVIPLAYLFALNKTFEKGSQAKQARETAQAQGTVLYTGNIPPALTPTPFAWMAGKDGTPYASATLQPTYTPAATRTPAPTNAPEVTPTASPALSSSIFQQAQELGFFPGYTEYYFMFSRYWPPLLGANCHPDNVTAEGCKDITSSGEKWSDWNYGHAKDSRFRGGVAVPLSYPLGVIIRVSWPESMKGDYLAVDYCPACDDYPGVTFIDFISDEQIRDYWTPIKAQITR